MYIYIHSYIHTYIHTYIHIQIFRLEPSSSSAVLDAAAQGFEFPEEVELNLSGEASGLGFGV